MTMRSYLKNRRVHLNLRVEAERLLQIFFLVLARDDSHVEEKIRELEVSEMPYLIVCGRNLNHPNVVYREPRGKYDAINFGFRFVPRDTDVVALNDVDTRIHNLQAALRHFKNNDVGLVFAKIVVRKGPQRVFYLFLDSIRRRIPITASGELMLIRHDVSEEILPLKPSKAEDTYILFKVLNHGHKAVFCEECYAETKRTESAEKEEIYKKINVTGIYQALSQTKAPLLVRLFYILLPFISPVLLVLGKRGYYWMKGILLGFLDYLRGDRAGYWEPTYMN